MIHFGNLNPNTNITKYAATFINCRLIAEVKSALKSTDIDAISLEGFLEILRARFRKLDLYLERSVEAWDISLSDDRVQEGEKRRCEYGVNPSNHVQSSNL